MKLSYKILVPTVLLILASVGAIYLGVVGKAGQMERERAHSLATSARSIQDMIDRCLFERYGDVQAFGLNVVVHRDLAGLTPEERAQVTEVINSYVKAYGCYVVSFVTDVSGRIVAINNQTVDGKELPSTQALLGRDVSGLDWFTRVKAGQFTTGKAADGSALLTGSVVGKPAQDPLVAQIYGNQAPVWTMGFSAPITTPAGKLVGYWHNEFAVTMIEQILTTAYTGLKAQGLATSEINIIDSDGTLVLDVDPSETGKNGTKVDDLFKDNFRSSGEPIALAAASSPEADGIATGNNVRMSKAGNSVVQVGGFARSQPTLGYIGSGFTTFVRVEPGEAYAIITNLKRTVQIAAVVGVVLATILMFLISRGITRAVDDVRRCIVAISRGDFTVSVSTKGRDEVAEMGRACNDTREGLKAVFRADKVDWAEVAAQRAKVDSLMSGMKRTLDAVASHSQTVASASEELTATAKQMTTASSASAEQTDVVAASSEQFSRNVATVATAAEEMSASIKEIARNAAESARVATSAVKVANDTNTTVAKLGESSNEIGEVIKVITSIAQQTNLLALNATIEAARAGEAGKGFAVVANEVKELARQTAAATEDIARKIEAIQTDTGGAVSAIGEISRIITQINDIQGTIASAVEQQSATTNEIARNAAEAARGSEEMTRSVAAISQGTRGITSGAQNTLSAAQELAKLAADLKGIVDRGTHTEAEAAPAPTVTRLTGAVAA